MAIVIPPELVNYELHGAVGKGKLNQYSDVKAVQELLKRRGAYSHLPPKGDDADGHFGLRTEAAIKKFQAEYVMSTADGLIFPGKNTWKKLKDPNAVPRGRQPAGVVSVVTNASCYAPSVTRLVQIMWYLTQFRMSDDGFGPLSAAQRARLADKTVEFKPELLRDIFPANTGTHTKNRGTSIGLCAAYVKFGLYAANFVDEYITTRLAVNLNLLSHGWEDQMASIFGAAESVPTAKLPAGAVIVYSANGGGAGHAEVWSGSEGIVRPEGGGLIVKQFMSDYVSERARTVALDSHNANAKDNILRNGRQRTVEHIFVKPNVFG